MTKCTLGGVAGPEPDDELLELLVAMDELRQADPVAFAALRESAVERQPRRVGRPSPPRSRDSAPR